MWTQLDAVLTARDAEHRQAAEAGASEASSAGVGLVSDLSSADSPTDVSIEHLSSPPPIEIKVNFAPFDAVGALTPTSPLAEIKKVLNVRGMLRRADDPSTANMVSDRCHWR